MALTDILLACDLLDQITVNQILNDSKTSGEGFLRAALRLGLLNEDQMVKVFSKKYRLPILDLKKITIPPDLLAMFPKVVMVEKHFLPVALKGLPGRETLIVALVDPSDETLQKDIERHAKKSVKFGLALPSEMWSTLQRLKGPKSIPGEDSEITELTLQPQLNDDEDMRMLEALTEPTHHGFRSEPIAADRDLQSLLREGNKTALLQGVIELLIQKKIFTMEEFLAAMELKK